MSFFHKEMSQNVWATIMPFEPVTNFLLAQKFVFGPALISSTATYSIQHYVSSTNKTEWHDITEILLKVALNNITLTPIITFCIFKLTVIL